MKSVLVLNGPNLGMLGKREPEIYGSTSLEDLASALKERATALGLNLDLRQTDHEGQLIAWVLEARGSAAGIILNPGALTHYSLALRDAVVASEVPVIEVHITNIFAREPWRKKSVISSVAVAVISGLGTHGYMLALDAFEYRIRTGG